MPSYPRSRILRTRLIPSDLTKRLNSPFELLENQVDPTLTRTALGQLDDRDLPNGTTKYVLGVGSFYLDRSRSDTANGTTILETSTEVGRWISNATISPYSTLQWDDVQGSIEDGRGGAALTHEVFRDTKLKMYFWRYNQNDELFFSYQLPHRWCVGTQVRPHIHVIPMANGAGNVVVDGHFFWSAIGAGIPALASWTTFKIITPLVALDQYEHSLLDLGLITPPAGALESSVLLIYMRRPGLADVDDTYQTTKDHGVGAANLGLLSADLHYQAEKAGTEIEIPTP